MVDLRLRASRGRGISYVLLSRSLPSVEPSSKRKSFDTNVRIIQRSEITDASLALAQVPYDKPQEALVLFNRWIRERKVGYA
jgi:hypothetical protein